MTLLQTSLEHGMGATRSVGCWSRYGHGKRLLRPPQLAASLHRRRQRSFCLSRILKGARVVGTNLRVGCSIFAATLLGLSGIFVHAPWSSYDDRSLSQDTLAKAACQ